MLALSLAACGSKSSAKCDPEKLEWTEVEKLAWMEQQNAKPWFEVTFESTVEETNAADLLGVINDEFGSNMVIFFGRNGSNGQESAETAAFRTVANSFVASTKYKIYYFNYDKSYAGNDAAAKTAEDTAKASVLTKLGLTAETAKPQLVTFIEGEKKHTTDASTLTDVEKLTAAIRVDFKLEKNVVTETHEIRSIEELQELVASGKKFLLFAGRKTCPDCKKMKDPSRDAVLNKLFRDFNGPIYLMYSDYFGAEKLSKMQSLEDMCEAKYYGCYEPGTNVGNVTLQREINLYRAILGLTVGHPRLIRPEFAPSDDVELVAGQNYYAEENGVYTKVKNPVVSDLGNYYEYQGYETHWIKEEVTDAQFDAAYATAETAAATAAGAAWAGYSDDAKRVATEEILFANTDIFATSKPSYADDAKWVGRFISSYWDIPALFVINAGTAAEIAANKVAQTVCDAIASSPIYTRNKAAEGFEPSGIAQFPTYFANAIAPRSGELMDTKENVESIYQNTLDWAITWAKLWNAAA